MRITLTAKEFEEAINLFLAQHPKSPFLGHETIIPKIGIIRVSTKRNGYGEDFQDGTITIDFVDK